MTTGPFPEDFLPAFHRLMAATGWKKAGVLRWERRTPAEGPGVIEKMRLRRWLSHPDLGIWELTPIYEGRIVYGGQHPRRFHRHGWTWAKGLRSWRLADAKPGHVAQEIITVSEEGRAAGLATLEAWINRPAQTP